VQQARELETQVGGIISSYDIGDLPTVQKELLITIKHQLTDARLDVRDYEYAETRAEQLNHAKEAKERLEGLQENILKASESDLFGAIDVAQLSARIQHVITQLA
jgi:hypothetical protein